MLSRGTDAGGKEQVMFSLIACQAHLTIGPPEKAGALAQGWAGVSSEVSLVTLGPRAWTWYQMHKSQPLAGVPIKIIIRRKSKHPGALTPP
jgi:hypothetical protein